jgi:hypothetical protein
MVKAAPLFPVAKQKFCDGFNSEEAIKGKRVPDRNPCELLEAYSYANNALAQAGQERKRKFTLANAEVFAILAE